MSGLCKQVISLGVFSVIELLICDFQFSYEKNQIVLKLCLLYNFPFLIYKDMLESFCQSSEGLFTTLVISFILDMVQHKIGTSVEWVESWCADHQL